MRSCWEKNTFTGLMMKYDSVVSNRYKFNLTSCLTHRAYKIFFPIILGSTMNSKSFVRFFTQTHTPALTWKCFRIKLNSIFDSPTPKLTAPKKPTFISIAFIDHSTEFPLNKRLSNIISKFYPHISLKNYNHEWNLSVQFLQVQRSDSFLAAHQCCLSI